MKLADTLLFVFAFVCLIIGIHQAMVVGFMESYWIFMFSLLALFLYGYRKNKAGASQQANMSTKNKGGKKKKKNG